VVSPDTLTDGAKSAKSPSDTLLSLLTLPHLGILAIFYVLAINCEVGIRLAPFTG
jgi:hypothetical protein